MRKTFLLLVLTLLAGCVLPGVTHAATLSKPSNNLGLLGYFPLNEGSGTIAHDFSGNGNDATFNGSASWTGGKYGTGVSTANTTSDKLLIGASGIDIGTMWSATAWFKYPLTTTGSTWNTLFRGLGGDHQVIVQRSDNQLGSWISGFHGSGFFMTSLSNGWHHLAVVGHGSAQDFYIDGAYVGTSSGESTTDIYSMGNYQGNNQNWGTFDEVRIYGRQLSATEVKAVYEAGHAHSTAADETGLVGHWTFDEGSGSIAHDFSGNAHSATLSGAVSWALGKYGGAVSFTGATAYVNAGNSTALKPSTTFTVGAWIKPESGAWWIVSNESGGKGFALFLGNGTDGTYSVGTHPALMISDGSAYHSLESPNAITFGEWHHIVATFDGTTTSLYVDGVLVASNATYGYTAHPTSNTLIGAWSTSSRFFTGRIDDVRIYDRALSATDVSKLYGSGSVKINDSRNNRLTNGLVGLWSFDGPDVTDKVYDRSGQGNNGYLVGIATSTAKAIGKIGQGLQFDSSSNQYVDVPHDASLNVTSLTITAWIEPTSESGINSIVSKYCPAGNYALRLSGGKLNFEPGSGSFSGSTVPLNTWTFVSVTYDNSSNLATLWQNATMDATSTVSGINQGTSDLCIGTDYLHDGTRNFIGSMDNVRIYNRALSASELKQLYDMGK